MGIFRKSASEPMAVTMAGVKLGDRFLSIGIRDTAFVAALAVKAGLTGRACAVDADAARASGGALAVEREGALVEVTHAPWGALPFDAASFDVAAARDVFSTLSPDEKSGCASEVFRVLRGGGRIVVVESTKRARVDASSLTASLTQAGFAAVRMLAEVDQMIFLEGIKKA